jgi:hypothetical protein
MQTGLALATEVIMKKLILALLLIPSLCFALEPIDFSQPIARMSVGIVGGGGGAAAPTYLFNETFSGNLECLSGYQSVCDTADRWTYAYGVVFAAGSATLDGFDQLYVDVTPADELYFAVKVNLSDNKQAIVVRDSSGNILCAAELYSNNLYTMNTGGSNQNDTATLTVGNDYYIKIRAKKGTGGNAECRAAWSSDGSTWTQTPLSNNGSWTAQPSQFYAHGDSITKVYKNVKISTSDINF